LIGEATNFITPLTSVHTHTPLIFSSGGGRCKSWGAQMIWRVGHVQSSRWYKWQVIKAGIKTGNEMKQTEGMPIQM